MTRAKVVLDTGPLVALMNRRDRHHEWAAATLAALEPPLWTCEAVLTEAAHLTGRPDAIVAKVDAGVLRIGLHVDEEAAAVQRLLERYSGRMDFADACVVRMSELLPRSRVMTLDRRDFTVYRRNGRDVIPLISPRA